MFVDFGLNFEGSGWFLVWWYKLSIEDRGSVRNKDWYRVLLISCRVFGEFVGDVLVGVSGGFFKLGVVFSSLDDVGFVFGNRGGEVVI